MKSVKIEKNKRFELDKCSIMASSPISRVCPKDFFRNPGTVVFKEGFNSCEFIGKGVKHAAYFHTDFEKRFEDCLFQGSDCMINICKGGSIFFSGCRFISDGAARVADIYAGARNIVFENCVFDLSGKSGRGFDIVLGKWSIWDMARRPFVYNVKIKDCSVLGRKKINILCLHASLPSIINTPSFRFLVPRQIISALWSCIRLFKKRFNKKIPKAVYKVYREDVDA